MISPIVPSVLVAPTGIPFSDGTTMPVSVVTMMPNSIGKGYL